MKFYPPPPPPPDYTKQMLRPSNSFLAYPGFFKKNPLLHRLAYLGLLLFLSLSHFQCSSGDDGSGGGATEYDYICENGTPKDGKSQTKNDNKCKACSEGYTLASETCTQAPTWPYECENGTPKDGRSLTEGENKCMACNASYRLDNEQCEPIPYVCENGTPKDGPALTPNENKCKACNEGYLLNNEACDSGHNYVCENGTPKDGLSLTPNENKCMACDQRYMLDNEQCEPIPYVCENGTPQEGQALTPGENKCQSCISTHVLDTNAACRTGHSYVCENGTERDGLSPTENDNKCISCDSNYLLDSFSMSCVAESTTPAGTGTEADPYSILTYAHLKLMGSGGSDMSMNYRLNQHYRLGADIDARASWSEGTSGCGAYAGDGQLNTGVCSDTSYTTQTACTAARGTWDLNRGVCSDPAYTDSEVCTGPRGTWTTLTPCAGWVPVGDLFSTSNKLTGSLDGNGHTISNLYIYVQSSSEVYAGLFSVAGTSAKIKNVGLTNIYMNVSSTISGIATNSRSGGLVGNNFGTIMNSYATGDIVSSSTALSPYAGGLAAENTGFIVNSYSTSSVTSTSSKVIGGSLAGSNFGGTIMNSYATGSVNVFSSGGLVGVNSTSNGTIMNSYATGSVTSFFASSTNSSVGGLVGLSFATINNSYATGDVGCVTGETCTSSSFGGLVGSLGTGSTISGKNYFVHNGAGTDDDDGVGGTGTCTNTVCIQATGSTAADRRTWMRDTFNEGTTLGWNPAVWDSLGVSGTFPKLKYVAGFCSNPAHTTQAACTGARATWRAVAACETIMFPPMANDITVNQGTQLPDCGDLITGQ